MNNSDHISFLLPAPKRGALFVCAVLLGFAVGSIIIGLIQRIGGTTPAILRISAVIQDVFVFILPALITALFVTRLPAQFLAIDRRPSSLKALASCGLLLLAIPAINALVAWNESITLPQSMSGIEKSMRIAEETARASIDVLIGGTSLGSLLVSILIVGVFAGLSEEMLFRGAFQRLMTTSGLRGPVAVWIAAFVFSAMHLQFYGFFGRLLLGAYFGYLLLWTRSLWIPIITHAFNNTLYIIGSYIETSSGGVPDINTFGADSPILIIFSVVLTVLGIYFLRRYCLRVPKTKSLK